MRNIRNHFGLFQNFAPQPILALAASGLALALLATSPVANGAEIQDGFYLRSDDTFLPEVSDQDGAAVRLGERRAVKVWEATVATQDNANSKFSVDVTILDYKEQQVGALVLGGKVYTRRKAAANYNFGFTCLGADNARNVARFLNVPATFRKHPGYNMAVSFTPSKPTFGVGEDVSVALRIENVGSNAFAFEDISNSPEATECQCTFVASLNNKQVDNIWKGGNIDGGVFDRVLKPGEVFTATIILSKWFAFDKPGVYDVVGSYYLAFKQTDGTIAPRRLVSPTVCEDYATGKFSVNVTPAKPH